MQRYFVEKIDNVITGNDFHHIKNVMRMKPGDFIIVCANKTCYKACIESITDKVTYQTLDQIESINDIDITLIQGLPKSNKIDTIIKYATCFGVSNIVFLQMDRSIAKNSNIDNKSKRYNTIAKEASELAHRNFVPNISFSDSFKEIDLENFDLVILADEEEKNNRLYNTEINTKTKRIAVIIGPEGGISQKEREYLKNRAISISLGNNILPTEVANLYLLAAINELVAKTSEK